MVGTWVNMPTTGPRGGVLNNAMVGRYCKTTRMRLRMWIERIDLGPEKGIVDQLQYEQIVDFEFMFGSSGGTTQWPHIQVNSSLIYLLAPEIVGRHCSKYPRIPRSVALAFGRSRR